VAEVLQCVVAEILRLPESTEAFNRSAADHSNTLSANPFAAEYFERWTWRNLGTDGCAPLVVALYKLPQYSPEFQHSFAIQNILTGELFRRKAATNLW
jgi:hypothetical protein